MHLKCDPPPPLRTYGGLVGDLTRECHYCFHMAAIMLFNGSNHPLCRGRGRGRGRGRVHLPLRFAGAYSMKTVKPGMDRLCTMPKDANASTYISV